jgi:hypothetical protein
MFYLRHTRRVFLIILVQVSGAVTDVKLWPSKAGASDFVTQGNFD